MNYWKASDEKKIIAINRIQQDFFGKITYIFDPPLPKGVLNRLKKIVTSAGIVKGDAVLDVGSGTGILLPLIQKYEPSAIYACDLSKSMLESLNKQHPYAKPVLADIRNLNLPDSSIDVVFVNACYSNLVDKKGFFNNIARIMKPDGRLVISHPMGKSFIDLLRARSPFPLDDFPEKKDAERLLEQQGLKIKLFIDKPNLYILVAVYSK